MDPDARSVERRPSYGRLAVAWVIGWLVVAPVPFLVIAFVLPGVAWLAALGLVVPVLVVEETRRDYGEQRWNALGHTEGIVFHVTYTERNGDTRI